MNATTRLGLEVTAARSAEMIGKLSAWLSAAYALLAASYAWFWQPPLLALTGITAALFAAVALWSRGGAAAWLIDALYVAIGLVIVGNVSVEYVISADPVHAIPFLLLQIAVPFFVPRRGMLVAFFALNVGAWLATSLAFDITGRIQDGVIGLITATGIGAMVFFARVRNNGRMEELRRAVEEGRDRDLREIIENNPDVVILVRDRQVVYANATAAATLKRDVDRLVGAAVDSLVVDGGDRLARGESAIVTVSRGDGQRVLLDVARPVDVEFEHAAATLLVARDVTESRAELNARLLLADRMSVAGTLAAGVAHEINNPLTYTAMNLALLEGLVGEHPDPEVVRLIGEIGDGVARVSSIVEDLDAVSRITDSRESASDPLTALRSAAKVASNQVRHLAKLEVDLQPVPEVVVNDGKLVQVFVNILLNAVDAVSDGDPATNLIELRARRDGDEVVVEVRDNGRGMSVDTRERIFDPFFTTKEPGSGTGLGMFFCHEVVTAAGGSIEVKSQPGAGTTVAVRLPAHARRRRYSRAKTPIPEVQQPLSILVIDDEPLVCEAIKRVLSPHRVTIALDGAAGVDRFRDERHDLVLCDLMMPGMSGQAVYEELREIDPTVDERIVFVTGGAFTPAAREFAERMTERVVKKPVAVDDLLRLVDDAAQRQKPTLSPPLA